MGDLAVLPLIVSIPAFILIGYTIADVVRRPDLSGLRKALWGAVAIVLPVLGVLAYLIARPFDDPAKAPAEANDRIAELMTLLIEHERGALADEAFVGATRRLFGDARGSLPSP